MCVPQFCSLAHINGGCLSFRGDEPHGQFVYEGTAGAKPIEVSTNGDQKQLLREAEGPRCRLAAKTVWQLRRSEPWRFVDLSSGWYGHGTHMIEGHEANWMVGWCVVLTGCHWAYYLIPMQIDGAIRVPYHFLLVACLTFPRLQGWWGG